MIFFFLPEKSEGGGSQGSALELEWPHAHLNPGRWGIQDPWRTRAVTLGKKLIFWELCGFCPSLGTAYGN